MKSILTLFLSFAVNSILAQANYTFTGNGLWTVPSNWYNNVIPPANLPSGSTIYLYTAFGDTCKLNVNQTISLGATLNAENAVFIVETGVI